MRDFPGDPVQEKIIHDFETIINDDEVKIVVEVMGGIEPAYLLKDRIIIRPLIEHLRQHIIRRTVQYTGNLLNLIRRQRRIERPDDRYAAACRISVER